MAPALSTGRPSSKNSMRRADLSGAWGEEIAAKYLRKKRCDIVAMNYNCRFGEIDIIAENREYLLFVEVKLRKDDSHGEAREFVTARKQQRLRTAAMLYLSQNPTEKQPRFDVIEIYAPQGIETKRPIIQHWEDAF